MICNKERRVNIFGDLLNKYESLQIEKLFPDVEKEFRQSLIKLRNQYIDLYGERVIRKILEDFNTSLKPAYSSINKKYNLDMLKGYVKTVLDSRNNKRENPLESDDESFLYKYLEDRFYFTIIDSSYKIALKENKTTHYEKSYTGNYFPYVNGNGYVYSMYASDLGVNITIDSNINLGFELEKYYKSFNGEIYDNITQIKDNRILNELVNLCNFTISINKFSTWEKFGSLSFDQMNKNLPKFLDYVGKESKRYSEGIDNVIKKYTNITTPLNQSSNFIAQKFIDDLLNAYTYSRQGEFINSLASMPRKLQLTLL